MESLIPLHFKQNKESSCQSSKKKILYKNGMVLNILLDLWYIVI